jgi:UDP-N-acetylmuramate dehydrogenase
MVLDVTFLLSTMSSLAIQDQAAKNLNWRKQKQPQLEDFPSCGSVFKKIDGVGAGRLIDQVGLKGTIIGGAQISTQHANFIVNRSNATANDVLELVALIQKSVEAQTGHHLEMEIELIGEF